MTYRAAGFIVAALAVMALASAGRAVADDGAAMTRPADDAEIAGLIQALSDASFDKRTAATRRLCAIGMPAAKALQAAAGGSDTETALRAQRILHTLERLFFAGAEITLSFSSSRLTWNESTDLTIMILNRSPYPTRLPFQLDEELRKQASPDELQVSDTLDVADWLSVHHADGRSIRLHVDDIAADAGILAAVEYRLNGGPTGILEPGKTATITIKGFNRGWARYALLDEGDYTVVFDYTPAWEDEVLAGRRVGRVVSKKARLRVTEGAPAIVSRSGELAAAILIRDGDELAAGITNRTDQTMRVNLNFGAVPPFADGNWVYEHDGRYIEVPIGSKGRTTWKDFKPNRMAGVAPGGSVELARIPVAELLRAFADAGADVTGTEWHVYFSYANACDRRWQTHQGAGLVDDPSAPAILREPLPRHLHALRVSTNTLTAPKPE